MPTRIIRQLVFATPAFEVKRRVCHDVIELSIFVKVICKRRIVLFSQVMRDTANSQVHFAESPCIRVAFLTNDRNICSVALMTFHKFMRLHEHASRTTAGIINRPAERFNHFCNQLHHAGRCIKLAIFFGSTCRIHLQKILIYAANQVFFMKARFGNFIYFIDQCLDFLLRCAQGGIKILCESAFQRRIIYLNIRHRLIQDHSNFI